MSRNFQDPMRKKMYAHYRTAEIAHNTLSSDRRMYWFGRFGYTAEASRIGKGEFIYPAWAAGYDRFLAEGLPNHVVHKARGVMVPATP